VEWTIWVEVALKEEAIDLYSRKQERRESMKSERGSKTKGSKNRRKLGHLRSHLDGNLS
jgi:hypothetical protein